MKKMEESPAHNKELNEGRVDVGYLAEVPNQIDVLDISRTAPDGTRLLSIVLNGRAIDRVSFEFDSVTGKPILNTDFVCITLDIDEEDSIINEVHRMDGREYDD